MYYDGGIFRDVYLYSAPLVHIQDYKVETDLDENYENATMKLNVTVANASKAAAEGYKVDVRLYDQDGKMFVNDMTMDLDTVPAADGDTDGSVSTAGSKLVLSPELWSAETPNLYTWFCPCTIPRQAPTWEAFPSSLDSVRSSLQNQK